MGALLYVFTIEFPCNSENLSHLSPISGNTYATRSLRFNALTSHSQYVLHSPLKSCCTSGLVFSI
ncbi:hypothetical protein C8Q76DRAFT_731445 [Earliella scabrosa]|nr:hypothetical protein C8Q76DRAFT_731445 [Earliella scabrosa]